MKSVTWFQGWMLPALLGLWSLCPTFAIAQSGGSTPALQQKVDQLATTSEKNLQELAKAMNQMSEMRTDLQAVKGQLDSAKYLTVENEKVYQDLDMRVSALEDKIGQIHTMIKEMRVAGGDPTTATQAAKASKEYEEFQGLLNLVNAQDYRSAASGFLGFLKKYPKSQMAGSAQFWVGESFFSMGDYTRAISEFQTLTEKYPQHPRVKEAVLKQGISFQKLKKYPQAKLFYQKALTAYPNSAEALQAQGRLSRLEALEGAAVALQSATPAPTPYPKPGSGEVRYDRPIMKPIPHPGANPPPTAPKPANTPTTQVPKPPEKSEAPLF